MDPLQKLAAIGRELVKSLVPNPAEPASNQHTLLQQVGLMLYVAAEDGMPRKFARAVIDVGPSQSVGSVGLTGPPLCCRFTAASSPIRFSVLDFDVMIS